MLQTILTAVKDYQTLVAACFAIVAALIAFTGAQLAARTQAKTAERNVLAQIRYSSEEAKRQLVRRRRAFANAVRIACSLVSHHSEVVIGITQNEWFTGLMPGSQLDAQIKVMKFIPPAVLNSTWEDFSLLDADLQSTVAELLRDMVGANELLEYARTHFEQNTIDLIAERISKVRDGTSKLIGALDRFLETHKELPPA